MTLATLEPLTDCARTTEARRAEWPDRSMFTDRVPARRTAFSDAVARMTHDIRTPLNAVIGFADLLQREFHGALGSDRYREYAGHIAECGARLLSVTEQTLLLAASAGGEMPTRRERACLRSVVLQAIASVEAGAVRRQMEVCCEIDHDCDVEVDQAAMRYAIANLIAAAARIATDGQVLTLKTTANGGVRSLDIELSAAPRGKRTTSDMAATDGHVGIARALLRLQGLDLSFGHVRRLPWSARITFDDDGQLQLL